MKVNSIVFKYKGDKYRVLKTNNYSGAIVGDEYDNIKKFYEVKGLDVIVR
jgi:hypothetical protein|tara:strand:- start:931 stop:1080 length:150 start_codon:yes stop_codon:yes gene_type:complete